MSFPAERIENFLKTITIYGIGLVVALIVLAFVVHRVRAWYRGGDDPADERDEIIRQLHESKLRGDLSDEEFRSIKSQFSRPDEKPRIHRRDG